MVAGTVTGTGTDGRNASAAPVTAISPALPGRGMKLTVLLSGETPTMIASPRPNVTFTPGRNFHPVALMVTTSFTAGVVLEKLTALENSAEGSEGSTRNGISLLRFPELTVT
jgi:hypothetical protein